MIQNKEKLSIGVRQLKNKEKDKQKNIKKTYLLSLSLIQNKEKLSIGVRQLTNMETDNQTNRKKTYKQR